MEHLAFISPHISAAQAPDGQDCFYQGTAKRKFCMQAATLLQGARQAWMEGDAGVNSIDFDIRQRKTSR